MNKIISAKAIKTRQYWIEEIRKLSGHFGNDTEKLEKELEAEIKKNGISSLIDHLRLCGNIPESYGHDTSEEKLYSKYTDCLLSLAYSALGLKSLVLKERADAADVEAFAKGYSFVADAKAFRLSRTAKNQKDFKVQANDATINGNETGTSFKQALYFQQIGFNLHDTMIFRKANPIPQIYRKRYNNEFEYMFVFSKGVVKTHNPIMVDCLHAGLELNGTTYKNFSKNEQTREKLAKPVKDKKIKGNIWEYVVGKKQEDQEAKGHPAPFPCELVRDHIKSWTNQGDLVFDPMSGSGTTARVACEMGRQYIGIDISHEYCEIARKRVKVIENVPTLFVVEESEETLHVTRVLR